MRVEWIEIPYGPNGHFKVTQDYLIVFFGTHLRMSSINGNTKIQFCLIHLKVSEYTSHMSVWHTKVEASVNIDFTLTIYCLAFNKPDTMSCS